jgi:pentatricopeptide repeat protein
MAALALARLAAARQPLLAQCGRLPALVARRLSSAPPPPVVSSQLVSERLVEVSKRIRNLVDLKKLDKALDTFHEAFEDADAAAAGKKGAAQGKAAGRIRRSTLRPDILVFNSLLRGFVDAGRLNAARDIVAWMRDKYGVTPSEVCASCIAS